MLCMYPFSTYMPFYSNTIFSIIIRNHRLQPVQASMCPAGNHFLQKYLFTAILSPVTLSITFIVYKQNMQRCAPHGMYPFSTKTLVCGSTIFSKTITKLYHLQAELASVRYACNHFLQINLTTILFSGIFIGY